MGGRSGRDRERREFGAGGTGYRYQMHEGRHSFGDDYWIEDADGDRCFRIDGRAVRRREALELTDAHGAPLFRIRQAFGSRGERASLERPDGTVVATVRGDPAPLDGTWQVLVEDGDRLEVHGNLLDHEYRFHTRGRTVAEVSKRWFRSRATFGVQIAPDADAVLILSAALALDALADPGAA